MGFTRLSRDFNLQCLWPDLNIFDSKPTKQNILNYSTTMGYTLCTNNTNL